MTKFFMMLCLLFMTTLGLCYKGKCFSQTKTVNNVLLEMAPRMQNVFPNVAEVTNGKPIAILAFKKERVLEVWKFFSTGWRKIKTYPFTDFSGKLGPKLKEGDRQIPEGIYKIEYLNPNSSYHLSLKVSYPNTFDKEMAQKDNRTNLGGDIFIHGKSVTIGCIPIGDKAIEELFYLIAKNGHHNTNVIIAPHDFRKDNSEPKIEILDWENKLYQNIKTALNTFYE